MDLFSLLAENLSLSDLTNAVLRYGFPLLALLILGLANLEQKMAIYAGRICLGREDTATLVAGGAALSVILPIPGCR